MSTVKVGKERFGSIEKTTAVVIYDDEEKKHYGNSDFILKVANFAPEYIQNILNNHKIAVKVNKDGVYFKLEDIKKAMQEEYDII